MSLCSSQDAEDAANDMLNEYFAAYEAGGYSPKLLSPNELEPGTIVVTEEDDLKRLEFARLQVVGTGKKVEVSMSKKLQKIMVNFQRAKN